MFNPFREFFAPKYVVGLHVTDKFIGAVRINNSLKGFEIDQIAYREVTNTEDIPDDLIDLFHEKNLRNGMLITCLPSSLTMIRQISLSFDKVKKLNKIIKYQMEPYIPYSVEDMIVDFLPPAPDKKIMTFGVRKEVLTEHMANLSLAKLVPTVVSLDDLALFYLYIHSNKEGAGQPVSIIHFSSDKKAVQVISENRLEFIRVLPAGKDELDQLENTFRLYKLERPDVPLRQILITGYPRVDEEMANKICALTEIETSVWKPFNELKHRRGKVETDLQARLSVPLGLALSMAEPSDKVFDLRKEEFANKNIVDLKKIFVFMLSSILLFTGLLTFNVYQQLHIQKNRHTELRQDIRQVFISTFPETRKIVKGQELAQMTQKIEEETGKYQWLEDLTSEDTVLDLLMILTRTISRFPNVRIEDLAIETKDIRLHGRAASFEILDKLKQNLLDTGYFTTIKLVGAKMDKKDKAVIFNFAMEKNQ